MANIASVAVLGQRSACIVRATRLGADCTPLVGDNNSVVAAAMVTATLTPDVTEGAKIEPTDACGNTSFTSVDPDVTKRQTIAMEFNTYDLALAEVLTDAAILLGATDSPWSGKAIGLEMPGSQTAHGNGAALEIWSKLVIGDGPCGADGTYPKWMRHIIPRTYLRLDDHSFSNDVATLKFTGWGTSNAMWGFGPYADWEAATPMGADKSYDMLYASTIPDLTMGYQTVHALVSS